MPKKYFVFDTSSIIFKYARQKTREARTITNRINRPFVAYAADRRQISLQIPSICMAECASAFAKICFDAQLYGDGKEDMEDAFRNLRSALLADVKTDRILNSFEVKREHYDNIEDIFYDDYNLGGLRGNTHRISGFDALVISVARDIGLNIAGDLDNVTLVTADGRMADICNGYRDKYPSAVNIRLNTINI